VTKNFVYKERYRLGIFGEVFNAFNIANLRGYGVYWTSGTESVGAEVRLRPADSAGPPDLRLRGTQSLSSGRARQLLMPQSLGNRYDRPLLPSFPSFTMREAC